MTKRTMLALVSVSACLAAVGPGCALTPPFKNGGPSVSREGVQVAVTKQRCDQIQEPDHYKDDLIEAVLEVQIRNATAAQLTVHRDAFRLRAPDGSAVRTQTWRAADPVTLGGGATGTFELRFNTRGGLECAGEMILDVDSGLALPEGPVKLGGVRFVPSPA